MEKYWQEADVVSTYTRKQALEDGLLVDVTEMAREAGIRVPTAVTAGLWADVHDMPPSKQGAQDPTGRLWDVLIMYHFRAWPALGEGDTVTYRLIMHQGRRTYYTVKAVVGPGDHGEPVLTLMRPDED